MAPEQVESRYVTPQTDLYALGLIVHEMLMGERVFTGDSAYTVWSQQVSAAAPDIRDERPGVPADMAGLIMCMLEKKAASRPDGANIVHTVLMRHAGQLGELVDDGDSPARMYAVAVSASAPGLDLSTSLTPLETIEVAQRSSATDVPIDDSSRGDMHRAVERARRLADESRYHPAIRHLETVVDAAVPILGARDADVVDARVEPAGLRFESENYAEAADLYRVLIDDLTSERGPYDDQVMVCQRRLAECVLHLGRKAEALDRLERLRGHMEARYSESDRWVVELAGTIAAIRS